MAYALKNPRIDHHPKNSSGNTSKTPRCRVSLLVSHIEASLSFYGWCPTPSISTPISISFTHGKSASARAHRESPEAPKTSLSSAAVSSCSAETKNELEAIMSLQHYADRGLSACDELAGADQLCGDWPAWLARKTRTKRPATISKTKTKFKLKDGDKDKSSSSCSS
mmetsp:Transcript_3451/g.7669  ORF Transcript_3451/g.7669 Transcript_3451/m.7669 type:complete len:167 (-) Transcript_3451:567-1067(-)